jgi:hypothetical protein
MSEELKACPFCGENVEVYKMTRLLGQDHPGFVRCDCVEGVSVARWNDRPIEDELRAELARRDEELALTEKKLCNIDRSARAEVARRDEIITRLVEDAERLASTYVSEVFPHEWVCRGGCHHWARFGEQIDHAPDCPIALHRALMKELEVANG